MAKSYVYLIENKSAGCVKIGYSTNPESRLKNLQTGSADVLRLIAKIPGTKMTEQALHFKFRTLRYHHEWFIDDDSIRNYFAGIIPPWKIWVVKIVGIIVIALSITSYFTNPEMGFHR